MKIVVTGSRGFPFIQGGIETHCEGLYPEIARLGHEVIVCRRKPYINASNDFTSYQNVQFKDLWAPSSPSFEAIAHTFISIIYARSVNADVLHVHGIGPALLVPFAKLLGLRTVFTSQGPDYDRLKWGRFAKMMLRLGEKFGTKYANEVIVVSPIIKNISEKKYKRFDTHLIPNGVYSVEKSNRTDYIESLGLTPKKYIIAVARFVEEKGFDFLVEAFASLKNENYKLVLVGDADHESDYSINLKAMAKANGVILTGFIKGEKLNQIFAHSRLFVLPSFHEGMSLAILEALGFDLDVLVSNIPANTQLNLSKDSYFKVGDKNDLVKKLAAKLNSYPVTQTFNLTNYQWESIAIKTNKLYSGAAIEPVIIEEPVSTFN